MAVDKPKRRSVYRGPELIFEPKLTALSRSIDYGSSDIYTRSKT